jgi:hypothetical protein
MVAILGAGLSARVGYPMFDEYASDLAQRFDVDTSAIQDASDMVSLVKEHLRLSGDLDRFHADLETTFGPDPQKSRFDSAHEMVIAAPFRGLVTANYDRVIEDAIAATGTGCESLDLCATRLFSVFEFLRSTSQGHNRAAVLHLHGYFRSPERLVITPEDYRARYGLYTQLSEDGEHQARSALDTLHRKVLWALFVTYPMLFVGFSMRDPALRSILQVIEQDFGRGQQPDHYAILGARDQFDADRQRAYVERFGVRPVFYPVGPAASGLPEDHGGMVELLKEICDHSTAALSGSPGEDFTARMLQL